MGYYGISDLLLFPSTFDTNGLVVREAAACATPSLLVRGSCAAEGVEDGKTGFLCVESAHSIKNTLNTIMENKELLKTVGKNAQSQIYISWEDAVKKAYERYYTVIDNFKTKTGVELLNNLKLDGKVLFVASEEAENLYMATRNLNNVLVLFPDEINVYDILNADYVVFDEASIKMVEEALK